MRTLIEIAADLVRLPDERTPANVYRGCKMLAFELREIHDEAQKEKPNMDPMRERLAELDRLRMIALKEACADYHRKHANCGTSAACAGLATLQALLLYSEPTQPAWQRKRDEILAALELH